MQIKLKYDLITNLIQVKKGRLMDSKPHTDSVWDHY